MRGAFTFSKALEDVLKNKKLPAFARLAGASAGGGMFGRSHVAKIIENLKINKDKPKPKAGGLAAAVKDLASKAVEGRENTKQPTLAKVVTDKKQTTETKSKAATSTAKKKEKKPVSPGVAAINV